VFNKLVQTVDETYICLEVNELSTNVSLTEYVMDVSAKLGSVHLTDYFFKGTFYAVGLKPVKRVEFQFSKVTY
jgi:hypothetical protein